MTLRYINSWLTLTLTLTSTRGWALDRVHDSRRPCGAVSLSGVTAERDGAARLSRRDVLHFLTLWFWLLTFWPFDLILIGGKVSWWTNPVLSLAILVSVVLILSCGQRDRQTESQKRMNAILTRLLMIWVRSCNVSRTTYDCVKPGFHLNAIACVSCVACVAFGWKPGFSLHRHLVLWLHDMASTRSIWSKKNVNNFCTNQGKGHVWKQHV